MEEDSAFLSLIMSDVIWREKQEVGLATHISLAEFQRREMIQREGRPCPVSPFQTPSTAGPSAGHLVGRCPKDSHLAKRGGQLASSFGGVAPVDAKRLHQR